MTIKALKITPEHEIEIVEIQGVLQEFCELIGCGTVQAIYGFDWGGPNWTAYIDDEGKWANPPLKQNIVGELLARNCGCMLEPRDHIVGTMLFVGAVDGNGNETSVPQKLIDLASYARERAIELLNRASTAFPTETPTEGGSPNG